MSRLIFATVLIVLITSSFLISSTIEMSTEYFVSEHGSDANSGLSVNASLKTIQEAVNRMKDGDRCWVRAGTYRESITITKNNLTIASYKGETVVISGLDYVKNWKPHQRGIYKATFSPEEKDNSENAWHLNGKGKYFLDVFLNESILKQATYPNLKGDILDWNNHGGLVKVMPDGKVLFTESGKLSWPPNFWRGGVFHGIVEKKFNAVQGIVSASGLSEIVCDSRTSGWKKSASQKFEEYLFSDIDGEISGVGRGFITNHIHALDQEKEWYWNKKDNILYFIPPAGIDPYKMVVEAKSRKLAFLISNCRGIRIEGIKTKSAGIELDNASDCAIENCSVIYPIPFYAHLDEYNGKSNITLKGNGNVIRNCYVAHSWGSGIEVIDGEKNTIDNNLVEDVDWMGTYNACIRVGGTETKIIHNTLRKSGRFLIQGTGVKKGVIKHNELSDAMLLGQDGGAFYTYVQDGAGTEIAFNWVHGIKGIPWERSEHDDHNITVGIYLDGGCKHFNVHHNIIWGTKYGIMYNATNGAKPNASIGNKMNYNTCYVSGQSAIVSKNLPQLYENNEASQNLSNKKIGSLALKEGNMIDENLALLHVSRYRLQKEGSIANFKEIKIGAYAGVAWWGAGADTTLIKF